MLKEGTRGVRAVPARKCGSSLWEIPQCWKAQSRCPRDSDFPRISPSLASLSFHPPPLKAGWATLLQVRCGHTESTQPLEGGPAVCPGRGAPSLSVAMTVSPVTLTTGLFPISTHPGLRSAQTRSWLSAWKDPASHLAGVSTRLSAGTTPAWELGWGEARGSDRDSGKLERVCPA